MDNHQISKILTSNPVTKKYYIGCFSSKTIPHGLNGTGFLIVNSGYKKNIIGHWLLFYFNNGKIIFFDSFAKDPLHYGGKILTFYLSYNNRRLALQRPSQNEKSMLCGAYCIFVGYYLCKGYSIDKLVKLISFTNKIKNDRIVEQFLYRLTGGKACNYRDRINISICYSRVFNSFCHGKCHCK